MKASGDDTHRGTLVGGWVGGEEIYVSTSHRLLQLAEAGENPVACIPVSSQTCGTGGGQVEESVLWHRFRLKACAGGEADADLVRCDRCRKMSD